MLNQKKTLAHSMILSNLLNFGSVDNFATPNSFYVGGIANVSFGSLFVSMFFFWVNGSRFFARWASKGPYARYTLLFFCPSPIGAQQGSANKAKYNLSSW
jgi:hypothetical protein